MVNTMGFWNIIVASVLVFSGLFDATLTSELCTSDEDFDKYEYMNLSVDPCEDFYEFTCGNFKNLYPLKDGQVLFDQFSILEGKLTQIVNEILKSDYEDDDPVALLKAKAAYQACVDTNYIDSRDLISPEAKIVNKYRGFPILDISAFGMEEKPFGWYDIAQVASEFGINIFFAPYLYYDTQNATRNILRISSDSMDIPVQFRTTIPKSYDDAIEEGFELMANNSRTGTKNGKQKATSTVSQMEQLLRKFVLKIKRIFGSTASEEYIFDRVANISNFMKGIYYGGYMPDGTVVEPITNDTSRQSVTLRELNVWTKKQFGNDFELDWVKYVKKLLQYTYVEVDEDFLVVHPYEFNILLYKIINWVRMNDPAIVKSTVLLRAFVYMASDSDSETRSFFDTYLKAIGKTVYERQEYCTRKIMDASGTLSLGLAVTYEYQKKYFDNSKLDSALELITNLRSSFKEIIEEAEWMDDQSKKAAQTKADNLISLLGYPEFITTPSLLDRFYQNLEMTAWNHYENARLIRAFQQAYTLNMISVRKRKAWEKSPFDANAYYNRQNNRIIFPVAMLNPIFFKGSDSLLDYGRIGMVIAHEITHGFDSQGFLYNPDGILGPWWTNETTVNFRKKTGCFVTQYSNYPIPEINSTISGDGSLNENIADNGGLRTAYKSLSKLLPKLKVQYGELLSNARYTIEQLFFLGYGTMWCSNESLSYLQDLQKSCNTTTNCHFRAKWRVNGVVSNMKEFSDAFNCPVGSPMNPETKCRLW